jgi:cold shock protein
MSVLIMVGTGTGVGDGDGDGNGAGPGVGDWAYTAGVTAAANAKASTTALSRPRPAPRPSRCDGCDEQRMVPFSKRSLPGPKAKKSPSLKPDLPLFGLKGQSVRVVAKSRLGEVVLPPPQPSRHLCAANRDFPSGGRSLPMMGFRVAIRATIGVGRSTVRFATLLDSEIEQTTGTVCGVARARARPRLFYVKSRRQAMPKGTVKWFNPTKGYGFIKPTVGDKDVFVHISAVERAGLSTLNENQVVEYDLVENRGKSSAENLKVS